MPHITDRVVHTKPSSVDFSIGAQGSSTQGPNLDFRAFNTTSLRRIRGVGRIGSERQLLPTMAMSNLCFSDTLSDSRDEREEIVVVTNKQYLAVAGDLLRRLFPELTPDFLPHPGAFSVFIKDDDYVPH